MPVCKNIQVARSKVCIGDMGEQILIVQRTIGPPVIGSVDPVTTFITLLQPFAAVKSIALSSGLPRRFDGINIEDTPTHEIYINYDATIWPLDSDNVFIKFGLRNFRIVGVDNMDEQNLTIRILVTERGVESLAGSEA